MTNLIRTLAVLTFSIVAVITDAVEISGHIKSCSGWQLNRMPEVKKFVMGHRDGAIGYENVVVTYVSHAPPVLTISHDSEETEEVPLTDMSFEDIHKMMADKGFVKKSADLFNADGNLIENDEPENTDDDDDDDEDDDDDFTDDDDYDEFEDDYDDDEDDYDDDDDDDQWQSEQEGNGEEL